MVGTCEKCTNLFCATDVPGIESIYSKERKERALNSKPAEASTPSATNTATALTTGSFSKAAVFRPWDEKKIHFNIFFELISGFL